MLKEKNLQGGNCYYHHEKNTKMDAWCQVSAGPDYMRIYDILFWYWQAVNAIKQVWGEVHLHEEV